MNSDNDKIHHILKHQDIQIEMGALSRTGLTTKDILSYNRLSHNVHQEIVKWPITDIYVLVNFKAVLKGMSSAYRDEGYKYKIHFAVISPSFPVMVNDILDTMRDMTFGKYVSKDVKQLFRDGLFTISFG